jgi:hypothetical protein
MSIASSSAAPCTRTGASVRQTEHRGTRFGTYLARPSKTRPKIAFYLQKLSVRDTGIEPVGTYLERPWQVPFAREIMWHQLSTPLDPRAYASFTSRFAITLLTACNSLKPNGPGLCTVPRRVRGEKTERQDDIPPKRPSSFRRYLGARHARQRAFCRGRLSARLHRHRAPRKLKLLNGVSPGRDSGGRLVKSPPNFERGCPEPPADLGAEALAEWERITPDWTG